MSGILCLLLACLVGPHARADSDRRRPGMTEVRTIAQHLYSNLDAASQKTVAAETILEDDDPNPRIRGFTEGKLARVRMSQTAVGIIEHVSLAMAIDKVERGYLSAYLASLSQFKPGAPLPPLPDTSNSRFARQSVVNGHLSNFNQIVGGVISIALSQLRLGIPDTTTATASPWLKAVQEGARESVACAYGVEGLADFYEALEKIPARPKWVGEFLPAGVKARKVRRDLERVSKSLLDR